MSHPTLVYRTCHEMQVIYIAGCYIVGYLGISHQYIKEKELLSSNKSGKIFLFLLTFSIFFMTLKTCLMWMFSGWRQHGEIFPSKTHFFKTTYSLMKTTNNYIIWTSAKISFTSSVISFWVLLTCIRCVDSLISLFYCSQYWVYNSIFIFCGSEKHLFIDFHNWSGKEGQW